MIAGWRQVILQYLSIHTMLNVAGKSVLSPTYRDKVLHFLVQ